VISCWAIFSATSRISSLSIRRFTFFSGMPSLVASSRASASQAGCLPVVFCYSMLNPVGPLVTLVELQQVSIGSVSSCVT
jgi:hypothetical protein